MVEEQDQMKQGPKQKGNLGKRPKQAPTSSEESKQEQPAKKKPKKEEEEKHHRSKAVEKKKKKKTLEQIGDEDYYEPDKE